MEDDESDLLGGSIGGLHQSDIARVVSNLIDDKGRAVEIRIRPEPMPNSHHYLVEWQRLEYDYGTMGWKPVTDRMRDDPE